MSAGYAMVLMLLVAVFAGAAVITLQYAAAARQATTAADLAALAGAGAAADGRDGCRAAQANAGANRARVEQCETRGAAVAVRVSVAVGSRVHGLPERVEAHAVAAPAPS